MKVNRSMKTKKKKVLTWGLKDFKAQYHFNIRYDDERDCIEAGCDSICRCGRIVNARIEDESVDRETLVNTYKNLKPNDFEKYCIDRILNSYKVHSPDNWDIEIVKGYYGQEIGNVIFNRTEKVDETVKKMMDLKTNKQKLLMVLELEYGYILDELKDKKSWRIRKVKREDLILGQKDHYKKVNRDIVEEYSCCPFPRGVCLPEGNKFRLIDGYHRIAACKDNQILVIC